MRMNGRKKPNSNLFYRNTAIIMMILLCFCMGSISYFMHTYQQNSYQNTSASIQNLVSDRTFTAQTLYASENLIEKQKDGSTKFITTLQSNDKRSFRRVITNSPYTSLDADTRDVFRIIEIIPDYTFTYFGWLVGGMEPVSNDTLLHLVNCDNGSVDFIFGDQAAINSSNNSMYAISKIPDCYQKLELEDYSKFKTSGSKDSNGWLIVKDGNKTVTESGYFKYVGEGKGLYALNANSFTKEYCAVEKGTGSYVPNVEKYVPSSTPEGNGEIYTGNNYDMHLTAHFGGESYNGSSYGVYGAYRFAYSASKNADGTEGEYIEKTRTVNNVYNADKNTTGSIQLVYYEYVGKWDGNGTDPYAGKRCMPNFESTRRDSVDGNQLYGNQFGYELDTQNMTFNPGNGKYKAKLYSWMPYQNKAGGDYDCIISNVKATTGAVDVASAGTNVNLSSWSGGSYVWVPITEEEAQNIQYTSYADFTKDKTTTNIYLKNFTRQYCYYSKNGYKNNEFFKQLCIGVTDRIDTSISDAQNYTLLLQDKAVMSTSMEDFDKQYRVEIVSLTPNQVTEADLFGANLIYAGEDTPYDGGAYSSGVAQEWRDYEKLSVHARYSYDLPSFTYVMDIFKNMMRTTGSPIPIMYSSSLAEAKDNAALGTDSNLYKLFMLLNVFGDHPEYMQEFIPSMQTDSKIKDYVNYIDETTGDIWIHCLDGAESPNYLNVDPSKYTWKNRSSWEYNDFLIWGNNSTYYWKMNGGKYEVNWKQFSGLVDNIEDGDHSLMYHWYTRGFTMSSYSSVKIHILLRGWNARLSVDIINAVQDYNGNKVIYVDEFDDGFPVEFQIVTSNGVSDVKCYFDNNGNGIVDGSDTLVETIPGSTLNSNADGSYIGKVNVQEQFGTVKKRSLLVYATDKKGKSEVAQTLIIVREIPNLN